MEIEVCHAPALAVAHSVPLAVAGILAGPSLLAAFGPDQVTGWVAALSTVAVTFGGLYSKLREGWAKDAADAARAAAEDWKERYEREKLWRGQDVAEMGETVTLLKQRITDLEAMIAALRRADGRTDRLRPGTTDPDPNPGPPTA